MAEAASRNRHLERLLDVTRKMAAVVEIHELLRTVLDAACDVLDCERATIFLYDADTDELYSLVATGEETIRFSADCGIAGSVAHSREMMNVPDAYADPRFNRDVDRNTGFRTRSLLTFPLENLEGELIGVMQALNKRGGPFDAQDEELARTLSAQAGVAIHRQTLLDEQADKQRMQRDLELARTIQQQLFPRENPTPPGYDIAGWNRCADETGGDVYDFVPLPEDRTAVLLADATGHGIGAALVIAQWRAMVRAMLSVNEDVGAVVEQVNALLDQDLSDDRFVTAFIGVLDPRHHRLDYVAPGQGPLLVLTADHVESRCATGLPLAITRDVPCGTDMFSFQPGTLVALLTDGFFEAATPDGEFFGEQRVCEYLREHRHEPLDRIIEGLHDEIRHFTHGEPQADDLTAVLVRRAS